MVSDIAIGGTADPLDVHLGGLFASDPVEPMSLPPSQEMAALDVLLPQNAFVRLPTNAQPRSRLPAPLAPPRVPTVYPPPREPNEPGLPEIGAIIDKYRIEELLGRGGFAVVYRATHMLLQRPVAIKLLRPKIVAKRPGLVQLLCNEARFAARINHRNVVRVYDVTHTPEVTYVVMEYINGPTLSQMITRKGALPVKMVLRLGIDVARGLKAGLEQGLIHRDIKPANILLTRAGETKIVDLGLAQPSKLSAEDEDAGRALVGSYVGTHGYMAPEQLLNPQRIDFRADIYSLGVTLFHAAVGRAPFPGKGKGAPASPTRDEPFPSAEVNEALAPGLARLLSWMIEKDPAGRPQTYDILLDAMMVASGR